MDEFSRLVERCDVVRDRRAVVCQSRGALCEASRIDCLMAVLDAIRLTKEDKSPRSKSNKILTSQK